MGLIVRDKNRNIEALPCEKQQNKLLAIRLQTDV
jgi:hypothetical protein